jgi:hypothetical protein
MHVQELRRPASSGQCADLASRTALCPPKLCAALTPIPPRAPAGSNNSSFNGRTVNWQKTKAIKARVVKKRVGTKQRHEKVAVAGVSGARTKKHQKKVERRARLQAKDAEALEAVMDVDAAAPAKAKAKKQKAKLAAAGDAPAAMQE